jgi:hypothetical protein
MIFSDLKLDKNKLAYSYCLKNDTNVTKHSIEFTYFCKMDQQINKSTNQQINKSTIMLQCIFVLYPYLTFFKG